MKVIVTGGSGFLGVALCHALKDAGHDVLNLDLKPNAEVHTEIVDVRVPAQLAPHFAGVEAVFHLASSIEAGESVKRPGDYIQNNIVGTLNVLEVMRENGVKKLLFSSSAAVYGEPIRTPIKEDDRTIPINPYGMTKLAMEGLVSSYVQSFEFTGVALRYFNLYGPGEQHQPETHAIPRFISQLMNDQEITLWGDGKNRRDFVYVDDVVHAHLAALELPQKYHYLNLSGKNATAVIDVVHMLEKITRKTAKIKQFSPRPGDPVELFADAAKAKEVLNWEAQMSIEQGLQHTVEWFAAHPITV
ncbi:MAG TPA: NAD-dependent epimerase/dehydratase family protein [Candidatus Saccharimonadia bacterium]|nr:NAD-dependent epimerase/dehydratase family protein [Candidatus Saccharimonadia bacterium]